MGNSSWTTGTASKRSFACCPTTLSFSRAAEVASAAVRAVRVFGALMLAAALVAGGYALGFQRGERARTGNCDEVVARKEAIFSEADQRLPTLSTGREQNQALLSLVEETAILVEQNPDCFSAAERAKAEADYRRWKRGS